MLSLELAYQQHEQLVQEARHARFLRQIERAQLAEQTGQRLAFWHKLSNRLRRTGRKVRTWYESGGTQSYVPSLHIDWE